jgi:hypothetical protein
MKRELGGWGYNRATLSLEDINTETWSSRIVQDGGWTLIRNVVQMQDRRYFYSRK